MSTLRILWLAAVAILFAGQGEGADAAAKTDTRPGTNPPRHVLMIRYAAGTFEIVGSSIKGITRREALTAALKKLRDKNPQAEYEVLAEKAKPETQRAIIDAITKAGIKLAHFWAATSIAPRLGAKTGPHPGYEDILERNHDHR